MYKKEVGGHIDIVQHPPAEFSDAKRHTNAQRFQNV